jgi:hypothetical protein
MTSVDRTPQGRSSAPAGPATPTAKPATPTPTAAGRPASPPAAAPPEHWEHAGRGIVLASAAGTAAFAVAAVVGAIAPTTAKYLAATVSLVLFAAGLLVFVWSYAVAVARSRTVEIGIGGLYFLAGSTAPPVVRRRLMGLFAIECVVALATAAARPFTPLAFGTLAPVYGLALAGLWGAKHGWFGPRVQPVRSARAAARATRAAAPPPAAPPASARQRPGTAPAGPRRDRSARAAPVRPPQAGVDQNAAPRSSGRRGSDRPRPRDPREDDPRHGRSGDAADHR